MNPKLEHLKTITFTGVDEYTSLEDLVEISENHPRVEFGILYSNKIDRTNRYPSYRFVKKLLEKAPSNVRFSIHFCGKSVDNLIQLQYKEVNLAVKNFLRGGRIQLNRKFKNKDFSSFEKFFEENSHPRNLNIILQYNNHNRKYCEQFIEAGHNNLSFLFDESGGRGIETDNYPFDFKHYCGYAGGLNVDNIERKLNQFRIMNSFPETRKTDFWIDMETGVRNGDDIFSIYKVKQIIKKIESI